MKLVSPPADVLLDHGQTLQNRGPEVRSARDSRPLQRAHYLPVPASQPWVVFGGDVLFAGSIGRTDFPDGDFEQLAGGIWRHLFALPDDTRVLPGHGPQTTVGEEKAAQSVRGKESEYGASGRRMGDRGIDKRK